MSEVSPAGSSRQIIPPIEKAAEKNTDQLVSGVAQRALGIQTEEGSERIEVLKGMPAASGSEIKNFAPAAIAAQAVESVKEELESKPLPTIHDNWASAEFGKAFQGEGSNENLVRTINRVRGHIENDKRIYQARLAQKPPTPMRNEVQKLLEQGEMRFVSGGKGGVYFLYDRQGAPQYVVKPSDEALLAIHNGKKLASPYLDEERVCSPVPNGKIYQSVQNAEIAAKTAELFGLEEVTPQMEVMVLEHPHFHDIMDGVEDKALVKAGPPVKEKVCVVQKFIPGCADIGQLLMEKTTLSPEETKRMMRENPDGYEQLQRKHTPQDIDQTKYEKLALLTFLIGEGDGNPGNLMCTVSPEAGQSRAIYKIDNAASFPESNSELRLGMIWAIHNYQKPLSPGMRERIQNLDPAKVDELKRFMRERNKSPESIRALDERIQTLKEASYPAEVTIQDLNLALEDLGAQEIK